MSDDRFTREASRSLAPQAAYRSDDDRVCTICGEPAVGVCEKCGAGYCTEHRGFEALPDEPPAEGEGPRVCWNCRLSTNAKAVLFWVAAGAVGLGLLIYFFTLWA
jgi:hypothetical protein